MKKIKSKDIILIAVIVIFAAVLLIVGLQSRKHSGTSTSTAEESTPAAAEQSPEVTDEPEEASDEVQSAEAEPETTDSEASDASTAAGQAKEYMETYAADSYLIVTTSQGVHTPIPLNQEGSFKISFSNGEYNIVHIGVNSFYMEESSCDNQNCVGEGEVTLENRDTRALYDMVLCLPHNVTLQLVDADEALSLLTEMYESVATEESATVSAAPEGDSADAG